MGTDYPEIRQAGQALLAVCDGARSDDGQGYNGFDSPFAADVLAKGNWSPKQAQAMYKMLRKYRVQLKNDHGIDYDAIPNPNTVQQTIVGGGQQTTVMRARTKRPEITHAVHDQYGLQFKVNFDYDPVVKDEFRDAIDITIWDPDTKTWIVPGKLSSQLLAFAKKVDWRWNDDALFEAMSRDRSLRDQAKERKEAVAASSAADSDFMADYESKSGHKLFPYQRAGVEYLVKRERAFLADQMGLGKTVQALGAIHATKGVPALIICPASVTSVWKKHVEEWLPGVAVTVAPQKPRTEHSRTIHITSYNRCTRDYDELMRHKWVTVICDEAHALKNRTAKRTQRICGHEDRRNGEKVVGLVEQARYRYMLSGTPVPNRPVELIQPLMGLDRLRDLGGFVTYATRYCGWEKGVPGSIQGSVHENLPELNEKLRASCWVRRKKADVLKDLPPKMTNHVPMVLAQNSPYWAAERNIVAFLDDDPGEAEALVKLTTLRRLAATEKVERVVEWIENFIESDQKLVLMGWHNEPLTKVYEHFKDKAVILTGSTSAKDRELAPERFQNDDSVRLFVGNIQAAGEGITLTAASNVAFLELPWKPGQVDQAADRIHRIGQDADEVMVHFLLADGTIDDHIAALIDEKRRVVRAIEDGDQVQETEMIKALMHRMTAAS